MLIQDVDFLEKENRPKTRGRGVFREHKFFSGASKRKALRKKEVRLFASSLASLLEGGIPLLKGLEVIRRESSKAPQKAEIFSRLENRVRQGESFSEALRGEPRSFPGFFPQMVRAGEESGTLDRVLRLLAEYLEKEEERSRKIAEAAAYPAIVLIAGIAAFIVLLKFVVPNIASVYEDFGTELPFLTRAVLAAADAFVPAALVLTAVAVPAVMALRKRKDLLVSFVLKIPAAGELIKESLLSFFSSLLALQLRSGIPVLKALDAVGAAVPWDFFRRDIERVRDSLAQGGSLAAALKPLEWIPETACVLLYSGQEAGRLPEALEQISREAGRQFDSRVHFVLKIIEPLFILVVGGAVGVVVISAILPILEINALVR